MDGLRKRRPWRGQPQVQPAQGCPRLSRTCCEGPFEELLGADGDVAPYNPLASTTKFQDDETGLLYYG
jgi:hypothetical protein